MEPGEALGIAAQIAVALAGFAGVVVVFRREAVHEWSEIDKLRLRLLLANSILPLALSMLGLLLLTIKPMPPGSWRWCSGMALIAQSVVRHSNYQNLPALKSPKCAAPRPHPIYFLSVRSLRHGNYALAIIQCSFARLVLAIFRWNRIPTRHGDGPICPDDPSAA